MKKFIIILLGFLAFQSHAQSLEDYVQIGLKNNPLIKMSEKKLEVAKEKINESGNWKDTDFSFGIYPSRPETRVGSQVLKGSIAQSFPWFGTYAQAKIVQNEKANLVSYDLMLSKKEIRYKIAELYYKMFFLKSDISLLKKNKRILETYENMALGALENNRAKMSDILQIRAEKKDLEAKIKEEIENLKSAKHAFNRLLKRPENEFVNLPDDLELTPFDSHSRNIKNHPSLIKVSHLLKVYEEEKKLINKQSKPKFMLGTSYIPVDPRIDANPFGNGKDVWMVSLGLKIPLFNKSYKSRLKQTELKRQEAEFNKENVLINLESAKEQAFTDYKNALVNRNSALANVKNLQAAINADLKGFETGLVDYDRILRLQLKKIKFELRAIKAKTKALISIEKIKYLTQ